MATTLPCPNPSCTQVFSQEALRGAASVTCPKCGMIFQFRVVKSTPAPPRAPAAPAPPPLAPRAAAPSKAAPAGTAPPVAQAVPVGPPQYPVAQPIARPTSLPPAPIAEAVPVTSPGDAAPEQDDLIVTSEPPAEGRPRPRGRSTRRLGRWLTAVAALGLMTAVTAMVVYVFMRDIEEYTGGIKPAEIEQYAPKGANISFRYPEAPWDRDPETQKLFEVDLAMHRTDPDAWLALKVKDYKNRMPRDDEVLRVASTRLSTYFNELEWKLQDQDKENEARLGERPARRLVFEGRRDIDVMKGECLMMAYQGVGYWFYTWAPAAGDPETVQQEWSKVRGGFTLLQERAKWTGKVPQLAEAQGQKARFSLRFYEDIWRQETSKDADLLLVGRDPDDPVLALKGATLTVLARPAQPQDLEKALREARGLYEAREREVFKDIKFDPAGQAERNGLPEGPVQLGGIKSSLARWRVKTGEERQRFVALAVVPWTGHTLLFMCECAWDHRSAWEERFWSVMHSISLPE